MVFFTDKDDTPYSIDQPQEFLTLKAIERNGRIVSFEDLPVTPDYIALLESNNALVLGTTNWLNGALIELPESDLTTIQGLYFVKNTEYVSPNERPAIGGRDEMLEEEEEVEATLPQFDILNIDRMHEEGYYGEGVLIAVLDGGFEDVDTGGYFSHIFEGNQVIDGHNFVTGGPDIYDHSRHGTRVFSTIAALGDDYEGIATKSNYLLYVTEAEFEYRIEEYNWLLAAERADSLGVDIISTSVGYSSFDDPTMDYTHDDLDGQTAVVTIAAEMAYARGILVVKSAGNEGSNAWQKVTPPADGEHVLAIGSVNESLVIAATSSLGPVNASWTKPDLMAMGQSTVMIGGAGTIVTRSGTSYTAPQVAGLLAGVWEKYPELTNDELRNLVLNTADRAGNPDFSYGYGVPSYSAMVNQVVSSFQVDQPDQLDFMHVYPNPVTGDIIHIDIKDPNTVDMVGVALYAADGKKVIEVSESVSWGNNPIQLSIGDLLQGIYILKIASDEHTLVKRIVIK
jgi:subtilisin family serine protease